ncbi:MAG: Uma2 family endonuclease [Chloroflexi bacterium]|nr:Uma2 family endonuclease [Chloroflexota bacterium]
MASLLQPEARLTPAEYLAMERQAETKSEYWAGEVYDVAGASEAHNLITANLVIRLGLQVVGRPCKVYTGDMRIKVARAGLYTYPDVTVVCGRARFEDGQRDTLLNPTLIVEVLSPSTESYDRGAKFESYRLLESLTDSLLVSQHSPTIEHYARQSDYRWLLTTYKGTEAIVSLSSIGCELRVAEVYDKVEWPGEDARSQRIRVVKELPQPYTAA